VGCGVTNVLDTVHCFYRFASKVQLWVLVVLKLSNISTAKACRLMY